MIRQAIVAAATSVLLAGGAAVAHGHDARGRPAHAPAPAAVALTVHAAAPVNLKGAIPGVVTAVAAGVLTVKANAAQLPANLAAETTGGPQVDAVLPLAQNVQILGGQGQLQVGQHVRVVMSGTKVTAVVIDGAPDPLPTPPQPAPRQGRRG